MMMRNPWLFLCCCCGLAFGGRLHAAGAPVGGHQVTVSVPELKKLTRPDGSTYYMVTVGETVTATATLQLWCWIAARHASVGVVGQTELDGK